MNDPRSEDKRESKILLLDDSALYELAMREDGADKICHVRATVTRAR